MPAQTKILGCNASRLFMLSFAWNIILIFMLNSETNHFSYIQKFYETNLSSIVHNTTHSASNKTTETQCKNVTKTIYITSYASNETNAIKHKQIKQENDNQWYYDLVPRSIRNTLPITHNKRPSRGQFNITETMLRQSRPIVGNTLRLHKILKQSLIYENKCLNIVTVGASVTGGSNAGGPKAAYSPKFEKWLNAKYPNCRSDNTDNTTHKHKVIAYTAGGGTIVKTVENFEALLTFTNNLHVDMIIIEYNVNDNFMGTSYTSILTQLSENENVNTNKNDMDVKSTTVNWYSELLIRRILSVNNHTALLFFDASFMDFYRHFEEGNEDGKQIQWLRYQILSYYSIPTISAVIPLFNLYQYCKNDNTVFQSKKNFTQYLKWFNKNMYGWWQIMTDRCCHPFQFGHMYLALTLAYNFDREIKWIKYHDSDLNYFEKQRNLWMPPLWRVKPKEYDMLTAKHITRVDIGAQKPTENVDYFNNNGFEWKSDTSRQKYGLIATEMFSHITFKIETKVGLVEVGFLATYEKISNAVVWIDDQQDIDVNYSPEKYALDGTFDWWDYWRKTQSLGKNKLMERTTIDTCLVDRVSVYNAATYLVKTPGVHFIHIFVVPATRIKFCCKFKLLYIGSS